MSGLRFPKLLLSLVLPLVLTCISVKGICQNIYELREVPTYGGAISEVNAINDSSIVVGEAQESNSKWSGFFINGFASNKVISNADALTFCCIDNTYYAYGVVDPAPNNYTAQLKAINSGLVNYFLNRGTYANNSMFGADRNGNFAVGNVHLVSNGPRIPTRMGGGIFFGYFPKTYPTLGGSEGEMRSINSSGDIVGWSNISSGAVHATIWVSGLTLDLAPSSSSSTAYNINDAGRIVGMVDNRAVYWADKNSTPTSMGSIGGTGSVVLFQNDMGEAVGYEQFASVRHGFIWTATGGMVDVNSLLPIGSGWTILEARGINNEGQIVGVGLNALGQQRGFILSPISRTVDFTEYFALHSNSDGRAWVTNVSTDNVFLQTPTITYPVMAPPGVGAHAVSISILNLQTANQAPVTLWGGNDGSFWISYGRFTHQQIPVYRFDTYGWHPYNSSWSAKDITTDSNNLTHVLLASVENLAVIWSIDPDGNVLRTKVVSNTAGYSPSRINAGKVGTDLNLRLVWKSSDGSGAIKITTLNPSTLATTSTIDVLTPTPGFSFQDLDVDYNGVPYLLWTAPLGAEIISKLNPLTGAISNSVQYGPYGAIDATSIAVQGGFFYPPVNGNYNPALPRILWNYWPEVGTNVAQIWFMTPNNTAYYGYYTYY